jgi:NTP pyrophosphatase (non-canonical NTP hydrolase)
MDAVKKLQVEHAEWLAREYPRQPPEVPAAGLVEEAGELLHAALKLEQVRIWGDDPRYPKLYDDLVDAVGDCAIYACSYCTAAGLDFAAVVGSAKSGASDGPLLRVAVTLVAVSAEVYFGRSIQRLVEYVSLLKHVCAFFGVDFGEAVQTTWVKVRERRRVCAS